MPEMKMPKARQNNRSPNRTVRFVLQSGNFFLLNYIIFYGILYCLIIMNIKPKIQEGYYGR